MKKQKKKHHGDNGHDFNVIMATNLASKSFYAFIMSLKSILVEDQSLQRPFNYAGDSSN